MSFKKIANKLIQEGFEKGGKLIEMGEFDPMYPEAPIGDPVDPATTAEIPTQMVSMDAELLKELLLWAGQEDQVAQNVVDKAVQLSAVGSLSLDHLMDLTGAADYDQPLPGAGNCLQGQTMGMVSPVIPSGPVSPVMASYQRRAKAIVESIERAKNISQDARAIKYKLKKLSESDRNYLREFLGNEEEVPEDEIEDIDVASDTLQGAVDDVTPTTDDEIEDIDVASDTLQGAVDDVTDTGIQVQPEEEIDIGPSKREIKDELEDIDFASNTLQGAVDGAAEVVDEVNPDTLDDIDPEILDGDEDGETINQQIADIKAKIDFIAHEIGLGDEVTPDMGVSNAVVDTEETDDLEIDIEDEDSDLEVEPVVPAETEDGDEVEVVEPEDTEGELEDGIEDEEEEEEEEEDDGDEEDD